MLKTIGFIGLGIMGKPMTKHLINAGYPLLVYNRTVSKALELVAMGARQVHSPMEVAENSDVMITMVADSPEVEQVIMGPTGVLEGAKPGSVVVDISSISPIVNAAELAKKNVAMLDAPVSGGEVGAIQATLSILVGETKRSSTR
jgi:3-hydroxyisobutyrate dehydrogenase-like beta-hydroxyacid dehydrogenase